MFLHSHTSHYQPILIVRHSQIFIIIPKGAKIPYLPSWRSRSILQWTEGFYSDSQNHISPPHRKCHCHTNNYILKREASQMVFTFIFLHRTTCKTPLVPWISIRCWAVEFALHLHPCKFTPIYLFFQNKCNRAYIPESAILYERQFCTLILYLLQHAFPTLKQCHWH